MPTNKATGTKINNGGSAFPMIQPALDPRASGFFAGDGMTLRDWFAGQALSIIPTLADKYYQNPETWDESAFANAAYKIADAMLAERERDTK